MLRLTSMASLTVALLAAGTGPDTRLLMGWVVSLESKISSAGPAP